MSDRAVYLYAVTRPLRPDDLAGVAGLDGAGVRVVEGGGLSALVGDVPLGEYGEQALRANLERIEWVEEVARRHHDVVVAATAVGPTAPVRLATVYNGDGPVREMLRAKTRRLAAVLARVAGRAEWGVKAYESTPATMGSAAGTPVCEPGADASTAEGAIRDLRTAGGTHDKPGTSYLMRRQARHRRQEERAGRLAARTDEIHTRLAEAAVASRLYPPQDRRLSGRTATMLLNVAYLVEERRLGEFTAAVERLAHDVDDLLIEATGPWPPYSFSELDEEDVR